MESYVARQNQVEVGFLIHQGKEFAALGASVEGCNLTAYTHKDKRGNITLRTWEGKTMLACRCEVVGRYRHPWNGDDGKALVFRLANGKAIVGYALADHGMLFRGELVEDNSYSFEHQANQIADYWVERDAEDEALNDAEMMDELDNE